MALGVSVIICCYNSAERLPETLRHLALQKVPVNIPWEIIIIDNASTDDTDKAAGEIWTSYAAKGIEFTILKEIVPGKNSALKKGIAEARFDYIITCDDDNWLCFNYIELAFTTIFSDPKIAVVGGCGIFEPEKPMMKEIEGLQSYFINGPQHWAKTQHWVYGAGAIYKKSMLIYLSSNGWNWITSGRVGKKLNGGEDVEICFAAYLLGYTITANDNLKFKHFVPQKRQNLTYILDVCFWQNYSNVLLNSYFPLIHNDHRPLKLILNRWLLGIIKTIFKQQATRFYLRFFKGQHATFDEKIILQSNLGTFAALLNKRKAIIKQHNRIKTLLALNE